MNIKFANRLVELRKLNGLSQEELADKIGVSRQAISKWERAESSPDTDNLICLAKLYNVSLDELIKIEDEQKEIEDNKAIEEKLEEPKDLEPVKKEHNKLKVLGRILYGLFIFISILLYFLISLLLIIERDSSRALSFIFLSPFSFLFVLSIIRCIKMKKINGLYYTWLALFLFFYYGLTKDKWHPMWLIILTIPIFYIVIGPINKSIINKRKEENKQE